jgi:hypothetical protein
MLPLTFFLNSDNDISFLYLLQNKSINFAPVSDAEVARLAVVAIADVLQLWAWKAGKHSASDLLCLFSACSLSLCLVC